MPLQTRYYPFRPDRPPDKIGVYELAWSNHIVYIGMGRINDRLRAHSRDETKRWHRYRCLITSDRRRARQIEKRELRTFRDRHDRLPKYNHQL
jgi:hypothetical protein